MTTKINALLRLPDVLAVFPVSRSTWYQGVKDGRYPLPVKIGARASAWRVSDIELLITNSPSAKRFQAG